ncbi:GntR family transcriptional regulator [Bosea sp. BK604]|nr:GntR family transcriptional regulator [Bosea sp. BK604]
MPDHAMMTAEESLSRAQGVIRGIIAARDDRNSLVTQIAIEVGAEIIEGVILPGHDLNSVELARRYKTSRTPIREALMLLEKEGLVDIPPRRRPRVLVMDTGTIREIYRIRAAILELVAGDVTKNATDDELAELAGTVADMAAACGNDDRRAYVWANIAFHDMNLAVSKNMTAKRLVEALLLRTFPLRRVSLSQPGRLAASLDDHQRLIKAYRDRDANLAAALIRSNHFNALRNIEQSATWRDRADRD